MSVIGLEEVADEVPANVVLGGACADVVPAKFGTCALDGMPSSWSRPGCTVRRDVGDACPVRPVWSAAALLIGGFLLCKFWLQRDVVCGCPGALSRGTCGQWTPETILSRAQKPQKGPKKGQANQRHSS